MIFKSILYALFQMTMLAGTGQITQEEETPRSAGRRANPDENTIGGRIEVPDGYERITVAENSFGAFLRNLSLKPENAPVHLYNGKLKRNQNAHCAVVDMTIGKKDLHQCADAIIRLRAEYLFRQKNYSAIHFNFTNGFRADYAEWRKGLRIRVEGNKCTWFTASAPSDGYDNFWSYLEAVFTWAGTLSLAGELKPASPRNLQIGDVFIKGGSPGHAVIVVDLARKRNTGEIIFLLAQSYMPTQELQVLKNPEDDDLSPWYSAHFGEILHTPEWTFGKNDLKKF